MTRFCDKGDEFFPVSLARQHTTLHGPYDAVWHWTLWVFCTVCGV